MSLFLGKIVGIYMLVVGISLLARQKMWSEVLHEFTKSRFLMAAVGFGELLLGLIVITLHNVWVQDWEVIITIVGWVMAIEGTAYMFLPTRMLRDKIRQFDRRSWYVVTGVLSVLIGVYLVYVSFGLAVG